MNNKINNPFLFDKSQFKQELKSTSNPLPLFKRTLKSGYQHLIEMFESSEDIELIVKQQSWLIDQLLICAWQHFISSDQLSLIAVGGYGRSELLLASDIDLMVLENSRIKKDSVQELQRFLAFLWDFGLEVGHSVRTVKECRSEAKNDITIMTNIMESRYLCGNKKLFEDMRKQISPKKIWPAKKYFEAKLTEQDARHKKYSESEYKLEPNIKESPGGLRDIQMIGWVAERHFGNLDIKVLIRQKVLNKDEYYSLMNGRNLLWRIRFALHMITERREDRLLFEFQRNVAELFGYKSDNNKGIEEFMKLYFKTVREINRLNDILLQNFQEEIIYKKRKEKITPLNVRFQKRNNYIEVVNKNIFKKYPFALLELFLLLQQHEKIKGVRASTIRLIRDNLHLIDDEFRKDIRNRSLFLEIIKQPNLVGHRLRQMHRYGILSAYMPAFAKIEGLMQFDLFHIFTVDQHILKVIQNMRLFGTNEYQEEFPVCHSIIKKLPKRELLYLAGFFHDIAKGRGGDHAKLGVKDALDFCKLHELSTFDSKLVAWLVEKHLLMSKTAQREDIDDPEVIMKFAQIVRDQIHLNYLYVLTVADICGTNPELWNSWRRTLLSNLYHRTLHELRRGDEKPLHINTRIKDTKQEALQLFENEKFDPKNINNLWKTIGNDYFIRHQPEEIAWHTAAILQHKDNNIPLAIVKNFPSRGGTLIFLYMKDKKNIFSTTTKSIEKLGLNIVDARIITSKKGFVMDTFVVLEKNGELVKSKERLSEIKKQIIKGTDSKLSFPKRGKWHEKRQLKSFNLPTRVIFSTDRKNNRTVMEVSTIDRPGVLSRISAAMDMCGTNLLGAKIATYGERVEDIFYLRNDDNAAISDPIKFECLENSIKDTLA